MLNKALFSIFHVSGMLEQMQYIDCSISTSAARDENASFLGSECAIYSLLYFPLMAFSKATARHFMVT